MFAFKQPTGYQPGAGNSSALVCSLWEGGGEEGGVGEREEMGERGERMNECIWFPVGQCLPLCLFAGFLMPPCATSTPRQIPAQVCTAQCLSFPFQGKRLDE